MKRPGAHRDGHPRRDTALGDHVGQRAGGEIDQPFGHSGCDRVADRAVQIYGGAGYIADYGIERFYRDVRLFRIYEGTTQIQQTVVARNMIREAQQG